MTFTSTNRATVASLVIALLGLTGVGQAQVPSLLNYQGAIRSGGTNFTGTGQFQFALVNTTGATTFWSNGTGVVSLSVTQGMYSVLLGSTNVANMAVLSPVLFTNTDVRLRVWFNDGVNGLQQLTPDQRVAAVGYALMAGNVVDGVVTSSKLAPGAVTTTALAAGAVTAAKIASGAVSASQLANNTITALNIAAGAITSVNIANNSITAANLAPGIGIVPSSTIVLSATATNVALTAAGFQPLGSNLGVNWTQVTNAAPWGPRSTTPVVFNGKIWILGGRQWAFPILNDVWSTSDGVAWTQVTNSAPWSPRYAYAVATFNSQLWIIGGDGNGMAANLSDIWSTSNGVTWMQITNAAPWGPRTGQAAVSFNGKLWVLGGQDQGNGTSGNYRNDIWSTSNGVVWTQVTNAAPWSARVAFGCVVFNNKMWILGGGTASGNLNDVWSTSDGVTWTQVTNSAPWSGREGAGVQVLSGQIWVYGGVDQTQMNDVWSTSDGVTWTQATGSASWSGRVAPGAVTFNNQLWMLGGYTSGFGGGTNDVWFSQNTITNSLGGFYLFQKQ